MNEERQNTYEYLIYLLLTSPSSELPEILKYHQDLLETGLVDKMKEWAELLYQQGEQETANFLNNLAYLLNNTIEADRLFQLGIQQYQDNRFKAASQSWQQSLTIYNEIGNYQGTVNSLNNLGEAYRFLGEYRQAIECYEQCLHITQEIGYRPGEAYSLGNMGEAYCSQGQYQQSIKYHQQSLEIKRELGDRSGESNSLIGLGKVFYALGEYQQAIKYHQQSLDLSREIGYRPGEAYSLGNLGNVFQALGQYQQVIKYHQQSLDISREIGDRFWEQASLQHLGNLFDSIGQYLQAIEYFQNSLTISRELADIQGEANALNNLGLVYSFLGQYSLAIDYYQQSLTIKRGIGDQLGESKSLGNLGNAFYALEQYQQAIEYHQQNLSIARSIGDCQGEANSLNNLGLAYNRLGQYQQAIEYHQQQLVIAREIGYPFGEGTSLNNLGSALLKSSQLAEAENKLREAIPVWESLRQGLKDIHKVSIFEQQARTYRLLQEVLILQNKTEEGLEIAERGRTRAFVELLVERFFSCSGNRVTPNLPTIDQIIQIAREQNLTLVEYSMVYKSKQEFKLYIWIVNPIGEIKFHQVELKYLRQQNISVSDLVIQLREFISLDDKQHRERHNTNTKISSIAKSISQSLRQLHQLLIEPITHFLPIAPNATIVFIPQDILFLVPFAALQNGEGKFLVEQYTVMMAPSIQVLQLTQTRSKKSLHISSEALVVGNPKMPTIPLTDPPVELPDLAWAKTEVNAIAPLLQTQPITGAAATKVKIVERMPKARLIHLATHGLLDDIRQLGVPGAIALAPSDEDNGFLTAGEIYNMKLNAELVVLSACSTGQGKITGDGVIGLSRCLIAAGVKSVIVSLWSVGDLSTAFLMVKFYQIFQQGVAASIALNEAQRWLLEVTKTELEDWIEANRSLLSPTLRMGLRRRLHQLDDNSKPFQHPRHWAAFSAIGQ